MELKQIHYSQPYVVSQLLIEPVWNWNEPEESRKESRKELLIEPVWNWNAAIDTICDDLLKLLIEPVWNWNIEIAAWNAGYPGAFNRTSMELKLIVLVVFNNGIEHF